MKFLIMMTVSGFILNASLNGQNVRMRSENFEAVNVTIEEVTYKSQNALKLKEIIKDQESIGLLKDIQFVEGTIEVELAGRPLPSANSTARGFIGIAFRVNIEDSIRYDCFYIRPTNGRANDQVRRNHSTQYIAHPAYPWFRLRKEFPGMYESYVDLREGEWTKIKIEVKGKQAKLYVHDSDQPALLINNLLNSKSSGGIALWNGDGTEGYFRNLKITKQ